MKTLKVLSIIGLVWYCLSIFCLAAFNNRYDYEAGIGWGFLGMLYAIAVAITTLVITSKSNGKQ